MISCLDACSSFLTGLPPSALKPAVPSPRGSQSEPAEQRHRRSKPSGGSHLPPSPDSDPQALHRLPPDLSSPPSPRSLHLAGPQTQPAMTSSGPLLMLFLLPRVPFPYASAQRAFTPLSVQLSCHRFGEASPPAPCARNSPFSPCSIFLHWLSRFLVHCISMLRWLPSSTVICQPRLCSLPLCPQGQGTWSRFSRLWNEWMSG